MRFISRTIYQTMILGSLDMVRSLLGEDLSVSHNQIWESVYENYGKVNKVKPLVKCAPGECFENPITIAP